MMGNPLISKEKKSNTTSEGESISKKIRKDSQSDAAGQQRKEEKIPRAARPASKRKKKKIQSDTAGVREREMYIIYIYI
jgi:hypothetical protein